MNRCPNCNASINEDDKYCIFCGTKIYDYTMKEEANTEEVKCKSCGATIKAGQNFCMECGAKRDEIEPKEGDSYVFDKAYDKNSRAYMFKDNLFKTIPEYFKNAFNFKGKACRAEYWFPYLIIEVLAVPILLSIIDIVLPQFVYTLSYPEFGLDYSFNLISIIIIALMWIPQLSCTFRRIRDTGRKPVAFLYCLIPFVGSFIMIYILASKTDSYTEPYI